MSVASAREIRAAVRAQMSAELAAREKAALSVASSWAKVEKARERLAGAEQEASSAVLAATEKVSVGDLAPLSGVPVAELRRLSKDGRQNATAPAAAADTAAPASAAAADASTD